MWKIYERIKDVAESATHADEILEFVIDSIFEVAVESSTQIKRRSTSLTVFDLDSIATGLH
jgi:hypothetical protein